MKTASIIAIGSELMRGKMDDSNSTFLARWLESKGFVVSRRINVADDIDDIVEAFELCSDSDLTLTTGGLGPTEDDLTRAALAKFLGKELVYSESVWSDIARYLGSRKYPLSESNKVQAYIIEGSRVIDNHKGTAPGIYYNAKNTVAILPGPPSENIPMVENQLFDILKSDGFITGGFYSEVYRLYNIGESYLTDLFKGLDDGYFEIGYYFSSEGFIELHFRKYTENGGRPQGFDEKVAVFIEILKQNDVFITQNKTLSQILASRVGVCGEKLAFAESCSGGMLSANFVKVAGVSSIYLGSVTAYSNEIKNSVLGVSTQTLAKYGAVSEETAREMASGVARITGATLSVATSGIAGPDGGTEDKPVGTVCFAIYHNGKLLSEQKLFSSLSREHFMQRVTNYAYMMLLKQLDY